MDVGKLQFHVFQFYFSIFKITHKVFVLFFENRILNLKSGEKWHESIKVRNRFCNRKSCDGKKKHFKVFYVKGFRRFFC